MAAPRRNWTAREITLIRENYAAIGAAGIQPMIPHRRLQEIRVRANDLGLKRASTKGGA